MIHSLGAKEFFPSNSNTAKEYSYYDLKAGPVPSFWQAPTTTAVQNEQKGGCKNCKKPKKMPVPKYVQMKVPRLAGRGLRTGGSLGTDGPGRMAGRSMRGWGKERAGMVGEGCGHMAEVVGRGIADTLRNAWSKGKAAVGKVAASAVYKSVQNSGLFKSIKDEVCAEAPKHKKDLPVYTSRMADKIVSGLSIPQAVAPTIHAMLKKFFLTQANNLAKGLQCGEGPKWWNKIKQVASKVRGFIEKNPVGRAIGRVAKSAYENYVPSGVRTAIKSAVNSAPGQSVMGYLDRETRGSGRKRLM